MLEDFTVARTANKNRTSHKRPIKAPPVSPPRGPPKSKVLKMPKKTVTPKKVTPSQKAVQAQKDAQSWLDQMRAPKVAPYRGRGTFRPGPYRQQQNERREQPRCSIIDTGAEEKVALDGQGRAIPHRPRPGHRRSLADDAYREGNARTAMQRG